jgi:hypothetical protein
MRLFMTRAWLSLLALTTAVPFAFGDTVVYRDRGSKDGKPKTVGGTITSDTVAGLTVKPVTGAEVVIPAGDVIELTFDLSGALNLPYNTALKEEKKSPADGIREFTALLPKLDPKSPAFRHVQFRVAMLEAQVVEDGAGGDEGYKVRLGKAVTALKKFKTDFPNCWQLTVCVKTLANLQLDGGDTKAALATMEELAANAGLSKETKEEIELQVIDLLLRAKDYRAADARVGKLLASLPAGSPGKSRLEVIQVGCTALVDGSKLPDAVAKLQAIIEDPKREPYLKALAHNVLGDCLLANGQKREALWSYLWVDVVYNQDRQEHVKALDRLVRLFAELKDDARAKYYEEKLKRVR